MKPKVQAIGITKKGKKIVAAIKAKLGADKA